MFHNPLPLLLSVIILLGTPSVLGQSQGGNKTTPGLFPPPPSFQVCDRLQTQLNSTIVQVRLHEEFQEVARGAWNLYNTLSQPACIIFPREESHVRAAMTAIYNSGGVRYAVQAGGHSAGRGWNTVGEEGILISFMHMSGVSYNETRDTITLQPGIRWGDAIRRLEPLGVAPLGGRLPDVGTGLLLGGGLSYLSAAHGFSVDSLVEADVVLVNGELVTATATNRYSDLFRALKGGANRFGIVTRYEVSAIHVGTNEDKYFWGGSIVYDNSTSEGLLRATANYVNNVEDPGTSLLVVFGVTFSNTTAMPVNVITFFYNGTGNPQEIYKDFLELPRLQNLTGTFSYLEANSILGNGDDRGFGQFFGASAFGNAQYDFEKAAMTPEANFGRYLNAFNKFQDFVASVSATPPISNERLPGPVTSPLPVTPGPRPSVPGPVFPEFPLPSTPGPRPSSPPTYPSPPGYPPLPPGVPPPWPIFPGPIFPGPWPGPPSSTDAGISTVLFAFTPVLKSQILAGQARGRNAIDPPVANYNLVQFHVQTLPGFKTDLGRIQAARSTFLRAIPASPGLPLYVNECDEDQWIFATYGGYNFLKQTYAKYDPTRFNMRFTVGPLGL
ncbi:FAD-binding domain-containing protein [Coprinopsis marcescibilis]|uniref:FAD-binding domain-containing protein n=1 Tax=Coprinopsis marcescibilis TaxID=230819 RepID=A0A5C3KVJ3_COPMA|nr:FAD-binding domain-containing protein [Coprinopsis marcescibilis]